MASYDVYEKDILDQMSIEDYSTIWRDAWVYQS
jgi:hypothetical protein